MFANYLGGWQLSQDDNETSSNLSSSDCWGAAHGIRRIVMANGRAEDFS
ncbi:unnamed protein product [Ixodes hexagonus]